MNYPDDVTGATPDAPWNKVGEGDEHEEYRARVNLGLSLLEELEETLEWLVENHPEKGNPFGSFPEWEPHVRYLLDRLDYQRRLYGRD